jgi:hypothetical protein
LAKSKQLLSGYSSISKSLGPHAKSGLQQHAASLFSATGHFILLKMSRGIAIAVRTLGFGQDGHSPESHPHM